MTEGHTAEAMLTQVHSQNRWRNLVLAALGAVVAVVVVVAIVVLVELNSTTSRQLVKATNAAKTSAQTAVQQTAALKAETTANTALLMQLQQILTSSHTQTDQLLLELINDNRRINGCTPLASVDQLAANPGCRIP